MKLNQQIERWINSRKNQFTLDDRPFVTVAYAQSLDGSITTRQGETLALSGEQAMQLTHQLRSLHDGILIGIETVLADDPQLTVREWQGPNPQPVVLDSLLRIPHSARLCHHPDKRCWVLTARSPTEGHELSADVFSLDNGGSARVPLKPALRLLRDRGVKSIMVEGGAAVISSFLKAGLVDALIVTIAPKIVGGYKAVSDLGTIPLNHFPALNPMFSDTLGQDIIVWGDMQFVGDRS